MNSKVKGVLQVLLVLVLIAAFASTTTDSTAAIFTSAVLMAKILPNI